ncbi:MAG TPA: hypothetical protein VKR59_13180 [Terriglobales bacterium]|nr:hypothetical protein [Terriglobales bacterium]
MPISGTNNNGPYTGPANSDTFPTYAPTATPPATGGLVPPQSPSGSVTNQASTSEYANSELAATNFTTQLQDAAQKGDAFTNCPAVAPGVAPYGPCVGLKEDVQTTPSAPSGSYVQQG